MDGNERTYRYYIACRQTRALTRLYPRRSSAGVEKYLTSSLSVDHFAEALSVVGRPSLDLFASDPKRDAAPRRSERERVERPLIVAVAIKGDEALEAVSSAVRKNDQLFLGGGSDIPISGTEHWCPREALDPIFADRHAALRLIRASDGGLGGLTGRNVNVVIVDQGLGAAQLEQLRGGSFGGGWAVGNVQPGTVASPHGMMVARNILAIAPHAKLFDLPLLPERIGDLQLYLSTADDAFRRVRNELDGGRTWVFVNAWSVYDRRLDSPSDPYCSSGAHLFNRLIGEIVDMDHHDVVFCAGNCGQFCPDGRCGPTTIGPGQSIVGANSHEKVLTVGAVRSDGLWLGYSSQGPGQEGLSFDKPDLCAPSQFRDPDDAARVNTGTSAAAAIAAGVIAALRERWGPNVVSPQQLIRVLRETAHSGLPGSWMHRLGSGIIDAGKAYAELESKYSDIRSDL